MNNTNNPKIALVLGGGSARGIAHVGVLKVLKEAKVPIDLIVGTSVGALIGASYALGVSLEKMEKIALKTTWRNLADFVISKTGFLEGLNLERIIKEATEYKEFTDLKIPLAIVATDIENGQEVVITNGDLARSIRASCSLAGIFIPVRVEGRLLADGGIKNSVPAHIARQLGATFIIAVDVGFCVKKAPITNIFQVMFQAVQISGQELNKYQSSLADIVISPNLPDDLDQLAFHKAKIAIEAGKNAAGDMLPTIKERLMKKGVAIR